MAKRLISLISLLLVIAMLAGCSNTDPTDILGGAELDILSDYSNFDASQGIPDDVVAALDYMVDNYTNGIKKIDKDDVKDDEVTDEDKKEDLGKKSKDTSTREKIVGELVAALADTEKGVTLRIPASMYSDDFIVDLYNEEIDGIYVIESMGVNAFTMSYYKDIITNTYVVDVTFVYLNFDGFTNGCSLDELRAMKKQVKQEAERLVDELKLEALSEYEAVKAVNEYLCDKITYSAGSSPFKPIQHTVYGALIDGDCVCEGYSKAAQLLFQMCGIESYYVTGDTSGGPHGWNIVKVDGDYYQLDITWNDVPGHSNKYFLVTDEYMKLSRTWDTSRFPKTANKPYKN